MIYHHLHHALRIMRQESDWRKWGPLIDALAPEQQAEVRPFLRDRARIAQYRQQGTKTVPTSDFSKVSSTGSRSSGKPKAGSTRSQPK